MKISEWKIFYTDEQVDTFIREFFERPIIASNPIDQHEMHEVYNKIVTNNNLNNRSKLFYLEKLEDLIVKSRINTTEDIIKFKDSLF